MSYFRDLMMAKTEPRLPKEYQEVQYLESSGYQYIDTGVVAVSGLVCKTTFSTTNLTASSNYVFGCWGESEARFQLSYASTLFVGIGSLYNSYANTTDNKKHVVNTINNIMYFDGVKKLNGDSSFTSKPNVCLFAVNGLTYTSSGWVYIISRYSNGIRIYDCEIGTKHLIPCYRKSDYKTGMYDINNSAFLANGGTQEFIVGGNV